MHNLKAMLIYSVLFILNIFTPLHAAPDAETKKTYIEDIFIWRMSDELKLTADEEKKFTEIQKRLNKQKAELNKQIQEVTASLEIATEKKLKTLRKSIKEYNQISLDEFDAMKKLLGSKKFALYLQVRSDLTNKVKTLLTGEKPTDKDKKENESSKLPPPQVILEKNE